MVAWLYILLGAGFAQALHGLVREHRRHKAMMRGFGDDWMRWALDYERLDRELGGDARAKAGAERCWDRALRDWRHGLGI